MNVKKKQKKKVTLHGGKQNEQNRIHDSKI